MSELIEILAPIFVLIILGFLSVKLRFLSSDDYPVLSSFVMKVAFPCLLLTKLSVLDLSKHFRWDILIIFLVCSLALAIVSISFFHHVLRRGYTLSVLEGGIGASLSNNGFIGYPILFLIFASPPMTTYATVLLVENLIMIPTIIFLLLHSQSPTADTFDNKLFGQTIRPLLTNPIIISVAIAAIFSSTSLYLPESIFRPLSLLGTIAAPLALFTIGMALIARPSLGDWTDIAWTSFGKLILHPTLVALCCLLFVDNFQDPNVYAVILLASSPMASLYPVFGAQYGAPGLTASCLSATTFLSLFTISGWILFLGI